MRFLTNGYRRKHLCLDLLPQPLTAPHRPVDRHLLSLCGASPCVTRTTQKILPAGTVSEALPLYACFWRERNSILNLFLSPSFFWGLNQLMLKLAFKKLTNNGLGDGKQVLPVSHTLYQLWCSKYDTKWTIVKNLQLSFTKRQFSSFLGPVFMFWSSA